MLVARIKANLAQYGRLKQTARHRQPQIRIGSILLQQDARRVFVDGREIALKNKEYELLLFLMLNVDIVFSKEALYERIWGYDAMGTAQRWRYTSTACGKRSNRILPRPDTSKPFGVPDTVSSRKKEDVLPWHG